MVKNSIEQIRHSLAHLLGAAVLELYPGSKLAIGPAVDDGFYYDIEVEGKISDDDLKRIETEMRKILKTWDKFEEIKETEKSANARYIGNPYKLELIQDLAARGDKITSYQSGRFVDLCRGGHVESGKDIDPEAFKLSHVAGAYWRGDEKNTQLTRIYGLAFNNKKELDDYIAMMEEAKKRDHRKLGEQLELFTFSNYVGPGLPLWLPKGTVIIEELEKLAKETELKAGYQQVRTPHIAKEEMYKTSGHLPYYAESMFPPMTVKEGGDVEQTYYLRAMNCPHHHQIYAARPRSYRELPMRLAEYGTVYRYEKSGELFGLMRVRMLSMNDAHIYCSPEQFADEFRAVNDMYIRYFKLFGFDKYVMRFSTHDPKELGKKYIDNPELWKKTEDMVRKVLIESKINYVEVPNEAAFYGPKIDVQVWSSIGKEFTIATNQVDFAVPERFGLTYTDNDGKEKTPLVIHRAPLGTHERFIGFLIEHYAGAFPIWLSPVQVAVLPISDNHIEWAEKVVSELKSTGIRTELNQDNETLGKKIRQAEKQKTPYILVIGDKEVTAQAIAVRQRSKGDLGQMKLGEFIKRVSSEVKDKIN